MLKPFSRPIYPIECIPETHENGPREVGASEGQTKRGVARLAVPKVAPRPANAAEVGKLLESPEIQRLVADLQETRWTGRPGYPVRTMVGLCLVKAMYALPTWTRVVALVKEHWALQRALCCEGEPPSVWSAYRFQQKLRDHWPMVERCIDAVVEGLREKLPSYGRDLAIDASDMPAYANGQRDIGEVEEPKRFSDPDAAWGRRSAISTRKGGSFYGYRLHLSACTATGLPVSWRVEPANVYEGWQVPMLLDEARRRGAIADTAAMDRGYDVPGVHADCAERDCLPVIPLKRTTGVKRGDHLPPRCKHGEWSFGGSDRKRGALPDRQVQARLDLDQGRPAAPPDPLQIEAVELDLSEARGGRARVRALEARMGTWTAACARA